MILYERVLSFTLLLYVGLAVILSIEPTVGVEAIPCPSGMDCMGMQPASGSEVTVSGGTAQPETGSCSASATRLTMQSTMVMLLPANASAESMPVAMVVAPHEHVGTSPPIMVMTPQRAYEQSKQIVIATPNRGSGNIMSMRS